MHLAVHIIKEIQMKFATALIAALFATGVYAADAKKEAKKADAQPAVVQPAAPVIPAAPVKSDAKAEKSAKADHKDSKKGDAKPAKKDQAKPAAKAGDAKVEAKPAADAAKK
jgi:hypothetical protein